MEPKHPSSLPPLQLKPVVPPNTPQNKQTQHAPGQVGPIAGINPMLMKPVLSESKAQQAAAIAMAMAKKSYNAQQLNAVTNGGTSSSSAVYSPLRGGIDIDAAAQAKPAMNPTSSFSPPMKPMTPEGLAMAQAKAAAGLTGTGNRMIISAKPGPPTHSMDISGQYVTVATQRVLSNQSDEGKDAIPSPSSSSQLQPPPSHGGIDQQYYQQQSTGMQAGGAGGGRGNMPNPNLTNPKPILSTSRRFGNNNTSPHGTMQGKPGNVSEKNPNSVRFKPVLEQSSISSKSSQIAPIDDSYINQDKSRKRDQSQSQNDFDNEEAGGLELVPYRESSHRHLPTQHSSRMMSNRGLLELGNWRSSAFLLGPGRKAEKQPPEKGSSFVDKEGRQTNETLGHQIDVVTHQFAASSRELKRSTEKQDRNCRRGMADQMKRGWNTVMNSRASIKAWRNRTFSPAETK